MSAETERFLARIIALQTALAHATTGYLHQTGEGTGYTVYHCRFCGQINYDPRAPTHRAGCPVQVLADSYREDEPLRRASS